MANCKIKIDDSQYISLGCNENEPGRILSVAFVDEEKYEEGNFTDASFWQTETYTGDIVLPAEFKTIRGSYNSAANKTPGKGNQGERTTGRTHTATLVIESTKTNETVIDDLNNSDNYHIFMLTNNYNTMWYSQVTVNIDLSLVIEEDLKTFGRWEGTVTWEEIRMPTSATPPAGIFN